MVSDAGSQPTEALLELRVEANLGRCWARASNPLCGTLCRGWVRLPLASATFLPVISKGTALRRGALAAVAIALAAHLILVPFRAGFRQMGTDFPNYYTAAALTLKHQPLRQFYDWGWFQRQIHYAGIDHQLGSYIPHTPLTMSPLLPLTRLPPPFLFYFAARRQWKALGGFLGAVAALGLLAITVFGWDGVWFFVTAVMTRSLDGSINDPYNPSFSSVTVFLRRIFVPDAELNPHPFWHAPAAFFFLRGLYTVAILALALVALAKNRQIEERKALAWFIIAVFAASANPVSYHFVLLLAPIAMLLAGEARLRSCILILLYVLAELALTPWDATWFPKAWLLLSLFLFAGWPFLRGVGRIPLAVTLLLVAAWSAVTTVARMGTSVLSLSQAGFILRPQYM